MIVPLKKHFPDYQGEEKDANAAGKFIQDMFVSLNTQERVIYSHITCATDSDNVNKVFLAVKDIVIRAGLAKAGLS